MDLLGAAIASFIGSTGIAGLLAGVVQLSRATRLRKSIRANSKLIEHIGHGSAAADALTAAMRKDVARLAAISLSKRHFVPERHGW